ncbi:MAG: FtsX-like permease family protein [Limnobacter sp.]|nr:FtsX-like permease family protein [Limnobacter sp.]
MSPALRLKLMLLWGAFKDQPIKWLIATAAIAIGVGLGLAIHLIHQKALEQFDSGVRQFSGQADIQLLPHSSELPDAVVEQLVGLPDVAVFSPVIDVQVRIAGLDKPVRWLGLDVFKAAAITPNWIGQTDEHVENTGGMSLLGSDSVYLSPALKEALGGVVGGAISGPISGSANGSTLRTLRKDQTEYIWKVAGTVPAAGSNQWVAVSDIAAVQWKLGEPGKISRVDIKLAEGVTADTFKDKHSKQFADVGRFETPKEQGTRGASVSQAYRANLSILAMVALLTGGFLSFSTQMLAVAQRSRQWALLASMGMKQTDVQRQIIFESIACGLTGSFLGLALGYGLATLILNQLGVDLGAGYFEQSDSGLNLRLGDALLYLGFGLTATGLGAILPSGQAGKIAVNSRLKAGSEESGLQFMNRAQWLGLTLCACAGFSLLIPPFESIPVGGYLAVAFGLFGGICLIGSVVRFTIQPAKTLSNLGELAKSRLASTPNLLAVGLSGVVASFALVVAMHVMIFSFRQSLDDWLVQVLPAPLYMRVTETSALPAIPDALQTNLRARAEFADIQFWGQEKLILDGNRPAVELVIRPLPLDQASSKLPMTGAYLSADEIQLRMAKTPDLLPIWISEPLTDLYQLKTGDTLMLNMDGSLKINALVAGVWRDYARQHGAIAMPQELLKLLYNHEATQRQASAWPVDGVSVDDLIGLIEEESQKLGLQDEFQFSQPGEIRELSLAIFDRSFAVTYLLEVAAVVIGLFGVGTTFSAMALQRKREFALLSALGASRKTLLKLVLQEGFLASWIAALVGMTMGLAFAAILIFVVNPQSFHWTMQWYTPWRDLVFMVAVLLVMGTVTVALAIQRSAGQQVVGQLKEDWS